MSIVAQQVVESRRYSGWLDRRYPIGYWQASLDLTGDASGGLIGLDLVFQTANGPERLNSQMYSVERFSINSSATTARVVRLTASNMGGPANLGFDHEYAVVVAVREGGSSVEAVSQALTPWFLGSQRLAGTTAALSIATTNVDTVIWHFEAEGYRWSPRSVLVDGGPQRPPTGLYPR